MKDPDPWARVIGRYGGEISVDFLRRGDQKKILTAVLEFNRSDRDRTEFTLAARKVARRVSKFDLKSLGYTRKHRTGITATTIKGWRDKFRGFADDSLGSMRYTHVLDSLEGADPEAAAVVALKFVLGSMLPENQEKPPS